MPLAGQLRQHVDLRASDNDVYATPSEYIGDLIRQDMEDWQVISGVVQSLREIQQGSLVNETIMDIFNEK